ncbi:MAG: glycosyltransferase [Bacteroidaceae bacterium]|nr:glycosyltransferase [Bacteroidaceae bacterium]
MQKKVSVVMCTYNGAAFVGQQLDSVLAQTYPLHEIIVQDDGSKDNTWEILEDYANRFPVIHLYHNEGRKGINGNFFSALHRATGDYIAICDQDDIWETNKIELQLQAIGSKLMCGGFSKPFSSDGFPVKWDDRVPCLHALRLAYLSEVPGHVQLIRKELLDLLPAQSMVTMFYDWQLQFIASVAEQIAFVPEVLVNFRRHTQAATATKPIETKGKEGRKTFLFLLSNHSPLHGYLKQRLQQIEKMLDFLEKKNPDMFATESVALVRKMIKYHCKRNFIGYIQLTFFCIKHRDLLFHAPEPKPWKARLRAAYFPLYCLNYYRGIVEN